MFASRDRCYSLPGLVYKIAIPVRTSHVWTSKISFVKGLSPFVNTTIDKVNPFVRFPDIVAI